MNSAYKFKKVHSVTISALVFVKGPTNKYFAGITDKNYISMLNTIVIFWDKLMEGMKFDQSILQDIFPQVQATSAVGAAIDRPTSGRRSISNALVS